VAWRSLDTKLVICRPLRHSAASHALPNSISWEDRLSQTPAKWLILLVGAAGFEPATWSTQNSRATRLRYAPPGFPGRISPWNTALPCEEEIDAVNTTLPLTVAMSVAPPLPCMAPSQNRDAGTVSGAGSGSRPGRRPRCQASGRYQRPLRGRPARVRRTK
jgi:hypothetical protein